MLLVEIIAIVCTCLSYIDLSDERIIQLVLSKPKVNETNSWMLNITPPLQNVFKDIDSKLNKIKDNLNLEIYEIDSNDNLKNENSLQLNSSQISASKLKSKNHTLRTICLKLENNDQKLRFRSEKSIEMCHQYRTFNLSQWNKRKTIRKRDLLNAIMYNKNQHNPFRIAQAFNVDSISKRYAAQNNQMKSTNKHKFEYSTSVTSNDEIETTFYMKQEDSSIEIQSTGTEVITMDGFTDGHEDKRENKEHKNNKDEAHLNRKSEYDDSTSLQDKPMIDTEVEDVIVSHGSSCDHMDQETCWFERAVGETLTLNVNISNFKEEYSFMVRWIRLYHKRIKSKDITIKIEPDRLPWNMVLGSGGRELRLNPITNTDMDPNSIAAKVFLVTIKKNKKEHQLIKELGFRIDIPAIDMRRVYLGEELSINLENFMTLPANGNFILDWRLEKPNSQSESLPSNFKISHSGRLVIIKEFKKEQMGILSCIVYSSNIAVAKRKFRIHKNEHHRRSLGMNERKEIFLVHGSRSPRHRCFRRAKAVAKLRKLMDYNKRISRRKRFRRDPYRTGCRYKHFHNRLHPRWIPSLFGEQETTLDPRLISVEKLIELSENSDGTLDDIIPHEVHYVEPVVTVISDDFQTQSIQANCTNNSDCGSGALCVLPKGQKQTNKDYKGYCYCKPEYFGDGFVCTRIPRNHRAKRIKRAPVTMDQDLQIQPGLFYAQKNKVTDTLMENENEENDKQQNSLEAERASKALEYEEEDAYLLSTCSNSKDCSPHAICFPSRKGHPFCQCSPGYRGNGIFCLEIMDYVPIARPAHALTLE